LIMDFESFKNEYLREELEIDQKKFGQIFCFLDFGNINHWFENDQRSSDGRALSFGEKWSVDLERLSILTSRFSKRNKKVILVHDGHTRTELKTGADLTISAQRIKKYVAIIKKTQRAQSGEGLDIGPVSTGRMPL